MQTDTLLALLGIVGVILVAEKALSGARASQGNPSSPGDGLFTQTTANEPTVYEGQPVGGLGY